MFALPTGTARTRRGLTLLELTVVITILAALAALVVVSTTGVLDDSRLQLTSSTQRETQKLIMNRYVPDMGGMMSTSNHILVRRGLPGPHPDHLAPSNRLENPQLVFLFVNPLNNQPTSTFDPLVGRGWRGPYLLAGSGNYPGMNANPITRGFTNTYGETGDPTVLDGWGNPLVIQGTTVIDAVLVSAGADGDLTTTSDNLSVPLVPLE